MVAKTPDQARQSAVPMPVKTPTASATSGTTGDFTDFLKTIAKSPALISGYSKLLKSAGYYKGKITSKYTPALQKAFTAAETDRVSVSAVSPIGRDEFLKQQVEFNVGGGDGGPSVVTSITAYTPESAKQLVDSIIRDTLGRKATDAEIKKYTAALKGIQNKAASTTTYKTVGGKQTQVTTPGINEQQYLVDQVAGTDEGRANKVLGFYETFMNALGGR